ncbi:hypothetical protein RvY_00503 [Ramazzottius varieornatus]|uniref:Ig-like domain-containing protein n=1 Tax=Ramazzottius varieornatus TaxID=947166 RepID=A0A1D1UGM8_RAMVA|nr:hypothetical protein RvY_00503 [Ramazzottius varieornatus]
MDKRLNGQRIAPMVAALWFTWIVSLGIYAEDLVRVAPSMQFENIYVERQDSLDLSCNFTGYPKPRISWQFQHASWGAGYVEKEGLEGYTCIDHVYIVHSSLRISNFNASRHEGRYECTGRATLENGMAISDKGTFAVHLTDSYSNLLVGDLSTD